MTLHTNLRGGDTVLLGDLGHGGVGKDVLLHRRHLQRHIGARSQRRVRGENHAHLGMVLHQLLLAQVWMQLNLDVNTLCVARQTWFTAGLIRAIFSKSMMSWQLKLETPMCLARPWSTSDSMAEM